MTQQEFFNRFTYSVRTDKIGGGSFGNVYKAYDNTLHREVAIKVSEVKTTTDGQKTFSLKDEFEALAHVPKHPNIANYEEFYSFESPQGVFDYAVMQYYPGGNLSDAIRQGLTLEQKKEVAAQLLEGIGFLHAHQVVHRDLKPGNILIVRHGGKVIPLITDFGLSKAANTGDGSMFSNSFGGGTQRYSSPEQLQGKPLRFNTDLWSFGSILYELFTGEKLFEASSGAADTAAAELEIYNKIIHGDVRALYGLPEKWRRVAERCLVVNPEQRARSVEELRQLIEVPQEDVDNGGGFVPPVVPENPAPASEETEVGGATVSATSVKDENKLAENPKETPKKPGKKRKGLVIGIIVAVLVLVGGVMLAMLLVNNPKPEATSVSTVVESKPEPKKQESKPDPKKQESKPVPAGYVDLGLPSGMLWKDKNEEGFYDYDAAVRTFGGKLPTKQQLEELETECQWTWTGSGYKVVGPNGQSIYLPAAGGRSCGGDVDYVGSLGYYWSSSPIGSGDAWYLRFDSGGVSMYNYYRCDGFAVRLVQD